MLQIVGNKYDLSKSDSNSKNLSEIESKIKELNIGDLDIVYTSAINGDNVIELFQNLAEECYKRFG